MCERSMPREASDATAVTEHDAPPEARLRETLLDAGMAEDAGITAAGAGIASPMRLGTEWAGFVVESGRDRMYAKVLHADMRPVIDFGRTAKISRAAAQAGVAPRVIHADAAQEVILFEHLGAPEWRWTRVDELTAPKARDALFGLLRRLHAIAPDASLPVHSPGEDIARLKQLCTTDGAPLPADHAWLDACVQLALHALHVKAPEMRVIHGDVIASNLMTGPDSALRLLDFDAAGVFDPWFDVAALLNESCQFEDEWRAGIVSWAGACTEADYARCRLYGLIHDWRWTLWGLWAGASSRRPLEFYKVGQWTLLRCRQTLRDPRFESWLRFVQR